jgi:hypothetical protein
MEEHQEIVKCLTSATEKFSKLPDTFANYLSIIKNNAENQTTNGISKI